MRALGIETSCDCAKRLAFKKNKEIMSQHFGNHISLSIEGAGLRYFAKGEVDRYYNNKERSTTVNQILSKLHFHLHFSDISLQNAALTDHNMNLLLTDLRGKHFEVICEFFLQYGWLFQTIQVCSHNLSIINISLELFDKH